MVDLLLAGTCCPSSSSSAICFSQVRVLFVGLSIVFSFGFNTILLCLAWCVWYPKSKNATSISSLSDLILPLGYNGDTRLGQKKVGSQSFLTWYKVFYFGVKILRDIRLSHAYWWKNDLLRLMCQMRQICVHFRAAFNVLGLASLNIWQATQCNDLCWACAGAWRPLARPQLARHEHRAGHRACCSSQRSSSQGLQFNLRISLSIKWGYVWFG